MSTNIPFCDETYNPWSGCTPVSKGCDNCYMYREKKRYGQNPSIVVRSTDSTFYKPLRYPSGISVFTCSWSDFFIENADAWRHDVWEIIAQRQDVKFIIITKRVDRIKKCLPSNWAAGYPNVVLGFTAEDQWLFDKRWSIIRTIPAAAYLCMHEPALGQIIYPNDFLTLGNRSWVIAGGETGPGARPSHERYFKLDRDQCSQFRTPFFFKQWGEWKWYSNWYSSFPPRSLDTFKWPDGSVSVRYGSTKTGNVLNGKEHKTIPELKLATPDQLSLF